MKKEIAKKKSNGANVGFEETLWSTADKMRNNMDPAEYKHVVLGLIFLKYISDSFEEVYKGIKADADYYDGQEEDKDAYLAEGVFWVPQEARWEYLKSNAKKPEIGKLLDDAMIAIEKDNPSLKGVLAKNYARPDLDKVRLGELIDLVSTIGLGDKESRSKDVLGRVYEYFLGRFASAEGKGGGEFFTPQSVVKLLVEMLEPYKGRIYDPCCGSGGMFVQSEKFVEAHGGQTHDLAIYGQESNPTTWRLCKMNLAIRGIDGNLGPQNADTFHNDLHKDLRADFILANPPFNISDWGGERLKDDVRWKYGVPPAGNANYGWIQHMIHHLAPTGIAGFVLANGSLSSNTSGEGEIRKKLIEAGLVDCIVTLPDKLFYTVPIAPCLWFVSRDRYDHKFRNRHDEILLIDARKIGNLVSSRNRELVDEDIQKIASVYHAWRTINGKYKDIKGFCKAAKIKDVEKSDYALTPSRYVGTEESTADQESFVDKIKKAYDFSNEHFRKINELETDVQKSLYEMGYETFAGIKFSVTQNSILEKFIQEIFKYWFVEFEFPNSEGKPYKSSGGQMKDSEVGSIPSEWKVGKLGNVIQNFDSKRIPLSGRERKQGLYPYYGATSIMDYVEDYIFDGTYVLLGEDGSVVKENGKPFVQYVTGKIWVNNHAHVIQGKNGFSTEYIKIFLDQVDILPFVTGAVQLKINQSNMNNIPIVIPDQETLARFNQVASLVFRMIVENENQAKLHL